MLSSKYIIGLTGGFASGKTTVANMFLHYGFTVIDADEIAREVVRPGEKAYESIVNQWGRSVLREDKNLDREKLAEIVFSDASQRHELEQILHPVIISTIWERVREAQNDKVIVVAPLLIETGMDENCDMVIVVTAPETLRIQRAVERDNTTESQVLSRMESQLPEIDKLSRADMVIDTDCDMEYLEKKVMSAVMEINERIGRIRGIR
jgi:dephospho-CoA kinase